MKRLLAGFAVTLVAAVWMAGAWFFFNSIALGAEGTGTPAVTRDEPAHGGHCGGDWMHHRKGGHLWKKLNLTDDQKKEMFSIRLEERAKIKPLVQKLKDGRSQLGTLARSGKFDEAKAQSIAKGQADIISQIIVEKTRMKSRLFAVLTPEQRTKAEQMMESWKAHREKEHGEKD